MNIIWPSVLQVLDEKPSCPVDLLETALLMKRSGGDQQPGASPMALVPVRGDAMRASALHA